MALAIALFLFIQGASAPSPAPSRASDPTAAQHTAALPIELSESVALGSQNAVVGAESTSAGDPGVTTEAQDASTARDTSTAQDSRTAQDTSTAQGANTTAGASTAQSPPANRRSPAETQRAARAKADAERAIEVPEVALSTLRSSRGQWLGREVRFTLQFETHSERWNPWLTRFSPSLYRGFQAWSDEQLLWRSEDYLDVAPRLFVRRGTEVERRLATALRYERFRVRARVLEIFLDEPWIEILEVESLPERVGEGTILHAVRGLEALDEGRPQIAASELDRAAAVPLLPAHVARELAALRALCVEDER